jgi:hypothetical protein
VDSIVKQIAANNYKFSSLVMAVVNSAPFQMRNGDVAQPAVMKTAATSVMESAKP